jgi:hypothetical protein
MTNLHSHTDVFDTSKHNAVHVSSILQVNQEQFLKVTDIHNLRYYCITVAIFVLLLMKLAALYKMCCNICTKYYTWSSVSRPEGMTFAQTY